MAQEVIYKRRFGDRKEGRLVRSIDPITKFMPYIMAQRNDGCNHFADSIEISATEKWIREKRAEGWKGMGMLHVFLAAYTRMLCHCPGVNRFVAGQKIYARNDVELCFMVKRAMTLEAGETPVKLHLQPDATIFDIYRMVNEKVDEIKANTGESGTEAFASMLGKLPGFIFRFAVWLIRVGDYMGWLPTSLLDLSPFHGSMIITDLGSLGLNPIYHHIYNFGTLPVFISFGTKRRVVELDKDGSPVERKYMDYKAVTDERICDGFYYSTAFKFLKYYLKNPAALELPPEKVEEDIF
ncbi:MAG: hypothetical protein IKV79_04690 [Oscillospiraceae bacterium]|nr:hypothetical protein [Oscillospiraceae bacterium]